MKVLLFLLVGVTLAERKTFWFEKSPESAEAEPKKFTLGELDNRYIINVMKYSTENSNQVEFACLGILIAADYALAPADCVSVLDPYKIAVQFVINEDYSADIGRESFFSRVCKYLRS